MKRPRVIPSCRDCKHSVEVGGWRGLECRRGAALTGAPLTCTEARQRHPWCWCGPLGLLFEHRVPWWRRLVNRLMG